MLVEPQYIFSGFIAQVNIVIKTVKFYCACPCVGKTLVQFFEETLENIQMRSPDKYYGFIVFFFCYPSKSSHIYRRYHS